MPKTHHESHYFHSQQLQDTASKSPPVQHTFLRMMSM